MKRFSMAVAALVLCATMSFAQGQNQSKEAFVVNFDKLSSYLELTPSQMGEVADINQYFIDKQIESVSANPVRYDKRMQQAVYGNLKLMKNALTNEQYRKYVALINLTNNNKQAIVMNTADDTYFAKK